MRRGLSSFYAFILILASGCVYSADNLKFEGELVRQPCVIAPGDESIPLDFGTIVDKYLYAHERTTSQTIVIHLTSCDQSLARMVDISLSGIESSEIPGFLSVSTGDKQPGFAIGLEKVNGGGRILINKDVDMKTELTSGSTNISFNAFVQASPESIAAKNISRGYFNAILNFSLSYE